MNKRVLSVIFALLLSASYAAAALELEQNYPVLPGGQTLTPDASLGEVVKYVVGLIILMCGIIVMVSLIKSGITYLTSSGNPDLMSQEKSRLLKSFLGITIIISSYAILSNLNPQLTVIKLEKPPISSNIVFLTESGLNSLVYQKALYSTNIKSIVDNLVRNKEAYYLLYDTKNLREVFGELTPSLLTSPPEGPRVPTELNFKEFRLKYLMFFKEAASGTMVVLFPKENFTDEEIAYTPEGKLGPNKKPLPETITEIIDGAKIISLKQDFFLTEVEYIDEEGNPTRGAYPHPPLSFKIKRANPGIYLYSDTKEAEEREERYFINSIQKLNSVNFNDKAKTIRIINGLLDDFLAVLYENEGFSGMFRIFFRKRALTETAEEVGNLENNFSEVSLEEVKDEYGKVSGVSSLQVFQINPNKEACNEVWLCTEPDLQGYCISYILPDKSEPRNPRVVKTYKILPVYKPINLPNSISVSTPEGIKNVKFNDNIRSIKISGKCLVALFENKTKDAPDYWTSDPGDHSEIFLGSETPIIPDLTQEHPIGKCRNIWNWLWITPAVCSISNICSSFERFLCSSCFGVGTKLSCVTGWSNLNT